MGPISIIQSSNFTQKTQGGNDWGKKAVSEILATESLLIKSAKVGYLTYYVFFTKALMGRFCGMAELLSKRSHIMIKRYSTTPGIFMFFSSDGLNMICKKTRNFFIIFRISLGGISVKLWEHILCTFFQVSTPSVLLAIFFPAVNAKALSKWQLAS